ncbi:MAG: hypothetical protein IMW94_10535 [Thermoanaerobacter sp.]|nr:hypothetical protein [Thermoanaerobacter sp.]
MSFKDTIQKDIGIFFNLDEFAEVHDIDGRDVPVVVDADILKERPRYSTGRFVAVDGVFLGDLVIYVRSADLGYHPVVGQFMRLNGELYRVTKCDEAEGILEITLEANEA